MPRSAGASSSIGSVFTAAARRSRRHRNIRAVQAELTAGVPLQLGGVEIRNLDPAITKAIKVCAPGCFRSAPAEIPTRMVLSADTLVCGRVVDGTVS